MHIPSSMLASSVCPVTAVAAVAGVGVSAYFAAKSNSPISVKRFAAVSALIFAAQMLNFQIADGTSGHLIGAALAVGLLGVPFAVLSLALVLTTQCVLFGDGGLDALGANIINMSLLAIMTTAAVLKACKFKYFDKSSSNYYKLAAAAFCSVLVACLGLCIELAFSGIAFSDVFRSMMLSHLPLAGAEAMISVALFSILAVKSDCSEKSFASFYAPLSLAVIFCILAPLACGMPDAFESVAAKLAIPSGSAVFCSPMPDYLMPCISNTTLATVAAAITGILAIVVVSSIRLAVQHVRK